MSCDFFFFCVFAVSPLRVLLRVHIFLLYTVPLIPSESSAPLCGATSSLASLPSCVAPTYVICFVCLMSNTLPGYGSLPLNGINTHIRAPSESAVIEIWNTFTQGTDTGQPYWKAWWLSTATCHLMGFDGEPGESKVPTDSTGRVQWAWQSRARSPADVCRTCFAFALYCFLAT